MQRRTVLTSLAILLIGLAALAGRPAVAEVRVYMWRGQGTGSVMPNARFQTFMKRALRGNPVTFADIPPKNAIPDAMTNSAIFFGNAHGGYLKETRLHVWQTGRKSGGTEWRISADDLKALRNRVGDRRMPRLIFMAGCDMFAPLPAGANTIRIPEALGYTAGVRGRAFLGFDSSITGVRLERFFRIYMALWTGKRRDGSYRTLREAAGDTKAHILRTIERIGNNQKMRRRLYINRQDAPYADQLIIAGDETLRYPDLLRRR